MTEPAEKSARPGWLHTAAPGYALASSRLAWLRNQASRIPGWLRQSRVRGIGLIIGLLVGLGGVVGLVTFATLSARDPWPVRVVIAPLGDARSQGFTADSRSYLTSTGTVLSSWDAVTGQAQSIPADLVVDRRSYASDGQSFVGVSGADFAASEVVWVEATFGAIRARYPIQGLQILHPTLEEGGRTIHAWIGDRRHLKAAVTWDVASGVETRRAILGPEAAGLPRNMPPVRTPDGRVWPYFDPTAPGVRLWDVEAGQSVGSLLRSPTSEPGVAPHALFTPDGRTLILGGTDGRIELWDVAQGRLLRSILVHPDRLAFVDLAIAPNGRTLASAGRVDRPLSIALGGRIIAARVLRGSARVATHEVALVDLLSGRTLARSAGSIKPEFAPDGRSIATQEPDGTFAIRAVPHSSDPAVSVPGPAGSR